MKVIQMTEAHLGAVAELERLCFGEPWSENALRLLLGDAAIGFVCIENDRVAAYGGMLFAPDEGQVTNVAVHPDFRRRGMGARIVEAFVAEAKRRDLEQISLEVRVSNAAAIGLYQGFGFYTAGVRKRFYRNPSEDAAVMLLDLNGQE
jgi:ribosomal-protein-alanine N-acetyltransferase